MKITSEFLRDKGACPEGYKWFIENFKDEGDYQAVLDKLADDNYPQWARWLIDNAGRTKDVLKVDGDLKKKNIFFAGSIEVKAFIS